jgi:hypothetical protein
MAVLHPSACASSNRAPEVLARRAAALTTWCDRAEAALVRGEDMDIAVYATATNTLRRLLADLGLERRSRDVTPSLSRYLDAQAIPEPAAGPLVAGTVDPVPEEAHEHPEAALAGC